MLKIFKYSFFYLLILIGVLSLYIFTDIHRNWTTYADQELTLSYNALLIKSNLPQLYLDHPGFFTIQISVLVLKILNGIDFIDINNVNEIGILKPIYLYLKDLVVNSRITTAISLFLLLTIVYTCLINLFKNCLDSFIAVLIVFFSTSIVSHTYQLRTELIAFALLFLSTYFFYKSLFGNNICKIFTTWLSLLLLILASLNKIQIFTISIFYSLLVIISCFLLTKNKNYSLIKYIKNYSRKLTTDIKLCFRKHSSNVIFHLLMPLVFYFFISLIFYIYTRYTNPGLLKPNIVIISFFLNSIYFYTYLLIYLISTNKLFIGVVYFNILYFTAYLASFFIIFFLDSADSINIWRVYSNPGLLINFASEKANYLTGSDQGIHSLLWGFMKRPIDFNILTINSQPIFLMVLFIFSIYYFYIKDWQKIKFLVLTIFFYICVCYIVNIRYPDWKYVVFQEFFLIIPLFVLINYFKKSFKTFFLFALMLSVVFINLPIIHLKLNDNDKVISNLVCESDWFKHDFPSINYDTFMKECKVESSRFIAR